jgi:hypothetical protein
LILILIDSTQGVIFLISAQMLIDLRSTLPEIVEDRICLESDLILLTIP